LRIQRLQADRRPKQTRADFQDQFKLPLSHILGHACCHPERPETDVAEHRIETFAWIAAPADRVWQTLVNFERMSEWNPFIRSISGSPETGARLAVCLSPPGKSDLRFRPEVLAAVPGRELRWRRALVFPGLFDGEHYFRLEPDGFGTRFVHGETVSGILVPLLMRRGVIEATRQGFEVMNDALKRVAEAEHTLVLPDRMNETSSIRIQEERLEHRDAVDALTRQAFGGDYEAELLERLRHEGLVIVSFVALDENKVVGHITLSVLPTEVDGKTLRAACLAPLSVDPLYRQQGVGAQLVRRGMQALREDEYHALFVLGDPSYYARFGFSSAMARKIECPFPGEAFMALELVLGALSGKKGSVKYPKAFLLGA
jgi:putative acetyltransferase